MQALRLWNQLHPRKKVSEEDFFVGVDLNLLKHDDETSHAKGDLKQEVDPDNKDVWTRVVREILVKEDSEEV